MNNRIEKHTLDLGDGTRCRAQINLNNIEHLSIEELPKVVRMDCEGPWNIVHFHRYVRWIAELFQKVADAANKPLSQPLFSPGGETVRIICQPGRRPELYSSFQLSLF
jgi:hypothetical protein